MKKGQLILVRDYEESQWQEAVFVAFQANKAITKGYPGTITWNIWRLPTEEEWKELKG